MLDWIKRLFGIDTYEVVFEGEEIPEDFQERTPEELEKENEGLE